MKLLDENKNVIKNGEDISFGIVDAGETVRQDLFLHNDTAAEVMDIFIRVDNPEVKIFNKPDKMGPHTTDAFYLEWTPSVDIKKGLKTKLNIRASELYS